jgi:carbon monoxide dehydrogenase subunit G
MKFTGDPQTINASREEVFDFLSDFNNFQKLMPEQVTDWTSTSESCSFTIQGITSLTLVYKLREPYHTVEVEPEGKTPLNFNLMVKLFNSEKEPNKTTGIVEIDADLNAMMAMIARRPFENLVNVMAEKLNEVFRD